MDWWHFRWHSTHFYIHVFSFENLIFNLAFQSNWIVAVLVSVHSDTNIKGSISSTKSHYTDTKATSFYQFIQQFKAFGLSRPVVVKNNLHIA